MQLYGGSVSSSVRSQLMNLDPNLASWLSVFDCDIDLGNRVVEDTICSILDNILSRGKPTLCSPYVEQVLAERLLLTQRTITGGSIRFGLAEPPDDRIGNLVNRSLVCVEPRLRHTELQLSLCDSNSDQEQEFLRTILPSTIGPYATQLLEPQRLLDSIVTSDRFKEQRVDFACEFPAKGREIRGLVIEIDGSQHDEEPQATLDTQRDEAVRPVGWQTVRIKTREFSHIPADKIAQLRGFFQDEYTQVVSENYQEPFWENEQARRVFQLVLVPLAVARIQKTLVQFIHSGVLSLDASEWKIAVLERDVPCASLAVDDFLQLLRSLLTLQGRNFTPKVELRAYCSEEFAASEMSKSVSPLPFEYKREIAGFHADRAVDPFDADALFDIAMLQHSGLTTIEPLLKERVAPNAVTAVIRSVHHIDATRRVASAEPVTYQLDSGEKEESLCYFLRYLFRKERFWDGQVGILKRALARKDVIGLLPTGAGKSLCYQLSALLQPGITLVVDPIKSLMHDQDDHLKEAGIDTTTFVDSSLEAAEKTRRIKRFQDGQFQFAFITPERLMIREFRNALTKMGTGASPKWFAYCVIDEAHCVSEWGHDFRPAYLRLGKNARTFCKPTSGDLPFIALTGTASFDVLSDVQRELQLNDEHAIVKLGSYRRKELCFEIITVQKPQDLPASKKKARELAAGQKKLYLANWLRKKLPHEFGYQSDRSGDFHERNGERTNSGLIFCPHVNYVFGIHKVTTYLKENLPKMAESIGKYAGKLDPVYLDKTQRRFRNNDLALLVATKSFGMGIDKPNIRYTLHFNMPPSIEAFYQEAGRAGRDQQKAVCALLFSEEFSDKGLMQHFIKDAFQGKNKEKTIIYELLNKIECSDTLRPGIEKILNTMVPNDTQTLLIPFENTRIKKIAEYTQKPEKKVHDAYKWRYTVENFARKLRVPVTAQLTTDFKHIRTESETFKAIYRMSVVGVIKDYTIDYNAKLIEAIIQKQPDNEYVKILTQYVSRFMSPEDAKRVPKEIMQQKGNTVLQKCLGYLIWFVYDRIKKRREEALDVMEQAARVGSYPNENPEKSKAECQRDFSDFVYNYFDSRYTQKLRKRLYDYNIDLVWQYIDEVNGEPGPTKHLRGSCDRLLEQNSDNAALLLLRAYARILLAYSEGDVLSDLQRGFELFKNQVGHSVAVNAASQFYREVEKQGNLGLSVIASAMSKLHLSWLREFNQRLEGE